jgi:tRNA(Ile)-lysidine synthase
MPVWLRSGRPHIYCGETLVSVPGLGIDFAFQARPGEPGVIPEWIAR